MKKYYFAHPTESRKYLLKEIEVLKKECKINLLNPFYDGPEKEQIQELDRQGLEMHDYEKTIDPNFVVEKDLEEIRKSDGMIAVLDSNFSIGTHMEVCYATLIGLPVFSVVLNGHDKHPFIQYFSSKVFTNFNDLITFLKELDGV